MASMDATGRPKSLARALWATLQTVSAVAFAVGAIYCFDQHRIAETPALQLTQPAGSANTFLVGAIGCGLATALLVSGATYHWKRVKIG